MVKTAVDAQNVYILRTYVLCSYIEEEEREEEECGEIKIMREKRERDEILRGVWW